MSNIGKKPIVIDQSVTVEITNNTVKATGPKGILETVLPGQVMVELSDGKIKVAKRIDNPETEKYFGLARTMVANIIKGVTVGFEKKLELVGVGYRARIDGRDLVLNLGFANPVKIMPPDGITIGIEENIITLKGLNSEHLGDLASKIRKIRPPDPYKGKGIRYVGEHIRKKAGKTGKTGAAA